jgi:predicted esterase
MLATAAVTLLALAACEEGPKTTALFAVPGASPADHFYDLPYPNDLRRYPDGTLDLSRFPTNSLIVDKLRAAAETLDGFGLNSAIYARFDGPLDAATLPDPAASLEPGASVYLVNVDPDSPERGARIPIVARFKPKGTQTIDDNHLVARPYPGFPLDEGTTYALVITKRVHDAAGNPIARADLLGHIVDGGGDAAIAAARAAYQPLLDYLDEPGDDERADLVSAAVFTTQHATFIAKALRKGVYAAPAPVATAVTRTTNNAIYSVWTGMYQAPNFQTGEPPYVNEPDGEIKVGADGAAIVSRTETLRFALSVPAGDVPADGWPLVVYSHGTGGDYMSFVNRTAASLAREGLAIISMDQVLHGPRNPGGNPELDFFNFGNPYAARDNAAQGFADAFSQLRLGVGLSIPDGQRTHHFDPTKIYFFGHSQGGITGPGFVAFEPSLSGAVLSGTAGLLYENLLHKTEPLNIPDLVQTFVRDEPVDEDNPSLALVQMWVDRSDCINYAPLMARKPATIDGVALAPRSIYQSEGFIDTYSPNIGIEAFATSLGGDIVQLPDFKAVEGLTLRGRTPKPAPITGNLNGVTAVLAQYEQESGSDGHFVVFDLPVAENHAAKFLGTLARTGQATMVAP